MSICSFEIPISSPLNPNRTFLIRGDGGKTPMSSEHFTLQDTSLQSAGTAHESDGINIVFSWVSPELLTPGFYYQFFFLNTVQCIIIGFSTTASNK